MFQICDYEGQIFHTDILSVVCGLVTDNFNSVSLHFV